MFEMLDCLIRLMVINISLSAYYRCSLSGIFVMKQSDRYGRKYSIYRFYVVINYLRTGNPTLLTYVKHEKQSLSRKSFNFVRR